MIASSSPAASELTCEAFFGDRLRVLQPRHGYRFSVDAVLLAHFISPDKGVRIVDFGTGCGILPLLLCFRQPLLKGLAVEIQPRLAALARENFLANGLRPGWQVEELDYRRLAGLFPVGSFDWAISNPPYRRAGSSRCNPAPEQARARHELSADLPSLAAAMRQALKTGGRAAVVYPAARTAALLSVFKGEELEPKRLQAVYDHPGCRAKLVLLEARKGGGEELAVMPPFYIHESKGGPFSAEMRRLYQP